MLRHSRSYYLFSAFLALSSLASLYFYGLNVGLDFKGGSLLEIKASNLSIEGVKDELSDLEFESLSVSRLGDKSFLLKSKTIDDQKKNRAIEQLRKIDPEVGESRFETVGPTIGKTLINKALLSVNLAVLAIIGYIAFVFRKIDKPYNSWRFGIIAIVALIHDVLITIGAFSLLGHFYSWIEIDSLFISAILAVLGFSVHDTIVVFDRIRENLQKTAGGDFEVIADRSLKETLGRSITTSFTTLLTLISLFLIGGATIKHFVLTLIIGISIGTYSSLFLATPLLVFWQKRKSP